MDKNLSVKLTIDAKGNVKGVAGESVRSLKSLENQSKITAQSMNTLSSATKVLGTALAGIGVFQVAKSALTTADNFNILQQRIKTATKATGDYSKVSKELFDIAQKTGTALEGNVVLFQSLARVAPEIGATNTQMLSLTKTLQQLGTIGGSTSEQMSNAMLQFGQAMAGGVMRAEEFNSIVENTPEIASRIAQGMEMTVGELRMAVLEGSVLSQDVFSALVSQTQEINKEFSNLAPTLEKAATMFGNSLDRFVGQADKSLSFTQQIALGLQGWSMWMDSINPQMTEHEKINLRIMEIRKKINEYGNVRGRNAGALKKLQAELLTIEERRAAIWKEMDAAKAKANKEAKDNAVVKAIEEENNDLEKLLDTAEQEDNWNQKRWQSTKSFREKQKKASENAIKQAQKEANKKAELDKKERDAKYTAEELSRQQEQDSLYAKEMMEWDRLDAYERHLERLAEAEKKSLDQRTKEYEKMVERIDGVFVDVWKDVINGTDNAFDAIKSMFNQLLAEMAHQAITKPIMLNVMGSVGLGSPTASGGFGSAGGVNPSGALSALGTASSFAGGYLSYGSSLWGAGGMGTLKGIGSLLGSGSAAGIAGGALGVLGAAAPVFAIDALTGGKISKFVSTGLFGGDWRVKQDNLNFDYSRESGLDASRYIYTKKSGGLFSSTKRKKRTYDMPELEGAFSDVINTMLIGLDENANRLGFDLADDFSTSFSRSIKKKSKDEIEKIVASSIESIYGRAIESMEGLSDFTDRFAIGEEKTSQTLERLLTQFDAVNASTAMVNQSIGELDQASVEAANNITALADGIEALNAASSVYYQSYFSEQEKFFDLYGQLSDSLADVYVALPTTRDAYRDLVQALDLSTESGQAQYATLMQLSGAADSYYQQLETAQSEYFKNQIEMLNTSLSSLYDLKDALKTTFNDVVATVSPLSYMGAQSTLSNILTGARNGILPTLENISPLLSVLSGNDASQYATFEDYQRDQLTTASMLDELSGYTIDAITVEEQMLSELQLHSDKLSGLDDSIVGLTDIMTLIGSFEQRGVWQQQLLDTKSKINEVQSQITDNQSKIDATDFLKSWNDALIGYDSSKWVSNAAYLAANPDVANNSKYRSKPWKHYKKYGKYENRALSLPDFDLVNAMSAFDTLFPDSSLANKSQSSLFDWLRDMVKSDNFSHLIFNDANLTSRIGNHQSALTSRSNYLEDLLKQQSTLEGILSDLPSFASGGVHSGGIRLVGERGPELEITGPSRIINSGQSQGVFADMSKMLAEMQALRQDFTRLQEQSNRINMSIANSNTVVAKYAKRADVIGLKVEVTNP